MLNSISNYILKFLIRKSSNFFYLRNAKNERYEWIAYKFLRRKKHWAYSEYDFLKGRTANKSVRINKTIFVYWKQGFENAPTIVKKCAESIKSHAGNYDVLFLTKNNLIDYCILPSCVIKKYDTGTISEALFSDLIRINLLFFYGGIWCDATCFWSSEMYDYVERSDVFFFKASLLRKISPIEGSSWFIKANQGNVLLKRTQLFLFEWFQHYNFIPNYYFFHLVMSFLIKEDDECADLWKRIPYICNMNPHVFLFHFDSDFDKEEYLWLLNSCFIHKLTYKYDTKLLNSPKKNMLQFFLNNDKV